MIERLLAADAALERDEAELAARLYGQVVEADPRNAIAVVGLANVAMHEGRRDEAKELAERALTIDPYEAAARRLLRELLLGRAAPPEPAVPNRAPVSMLLDDSPALPAPNAPPAPREVDAGAGAVAGAGDRADADLQVDRPSFLDRLRRWLGLGRRG